MPNGEAAASINLIVFGLTRSRFVLMINHARDEHANHYTTDLFFSLSIFPILLYLFQKWSVCRMLMTVWLRFMVFNATFNNISVISWLSALLMEETVVPGENHRPDASHLQTWSHNAVLSTPRHERGSNHNDSSGNHWLHMQLYIQLSYDHDHHDLVNDGVHTQHTV